MTQNEGRKEKKERKEKTLEIILVIHIKVLLVKRVSERGKVGETVYIPKY